MYRMTLLFIQKRVRLLFPRVPQLTTLYKAYPHLIPPLSRFLSVHPLPYLHSLSLLPFPLSLSSPLSLSLPFPFPHKSTRSPSSFRSSAPNFGNYPVFISPYKNLLSHCTQTRHSPAAHSYHRLLLARARPVLPRYVYRHRRSIHFVSCTYLSIYPQRSTPRNGNHSQAHRRSCHLLPHSTPHSLLSRINSD